MDTRARSRNDQEGFTNRLIEIVENAQSSYGKIYSVERFLEDVREVIALLDGLGQSSDQAEMQAKQTIELLAEAVGVGNPVWN